MKTLRAMVLAVAFFAVAFSPLVTRFASAGVTCPLPFLLVNGVVADASQVMANYNALVTCLTNAAAAGANTDITALLGLTTPITPTQGGTQTYPAATTGTANAVVLTTSLSGFSLTNGARVVFQPSSNNTDAATVNVNGTGVRNIFRRTSLGAVSTAGGELLAGTITELAYDGAQFQIINGSIVKVGEITDFAGTVAPLDEVLADGSCQLRLGKFAALYSVIGTAYDPTGSTCDVSHFALPDGRSRAFFGADNYGQGAANRITLAASGCTPSLGAGCGFQTHLQLVTELAAHTHTITDPGHAHGYSAGFTPLNGTSAGGGPAGGAAGNFVTNSGTTGITVNATAAAVAMPILNPMQFVTKKIKF